MIETTHKLRLIAMLAVMILLVGRIPTSDADVTFFIQRQGSPNDDGWALFIQAVGTFHEQDFEGPEFAPDGVEVRKLGFGQMELKLTLPLEKPLRPFTFSSAEFNAPGRFFHRSLESGMALTITAKGKRLARGLGMWIFDDVRAFDSAYLIEVTEKNGATWQAVLENQIGRNSHGHEIEGFIGAVSDLGIRAMTITPIDPLTGAVQPDFFETDHWVVAEFDSPQNMDDSSDDSGEEDDGKDEDDDSSDSEDDDEDDSAASVEGERTRDDSEDHQRKRH